MERPQNITLVIRPRSRSQGSAKRSKLAYFAHFCELLLEFSSDHHQKLGKMCRMNVQKNVRSWNFELLTQSIFTWGQTFKKSKKSKTRYFFAIQISPAFCLVRMRAQLLYIFNRNSKILIFGRLRAKNVIIYAIFDINSKNTQFYQSLVSFY